MTFLYETHLHTCQGSACGHSTGAEHARHYKALGYAGIFVTDHFYRGNSAIPREMPWEEWVERFCQGYEDARAEGERIGLDVFFGWEESIDGDDYLIYGLDKAWLLRHPEVRSWTRAEQYEQVRAAGGCVVQAHPFRIRDYIRTIWLSEQLVDGVEVANAGNRPSDDLYARAYARSLSLPMTAGSDNHLSQPGKELFGVETPCRLSCPADYVRLILSREQLGLHVPPDRFDPVNLLPISLPVCRLDRRGEPSSCFAPGETTPWHPRGRCPLDPCQRDTVPLDSHPGV